MQKVVWIITFQTRDSGSYQRIHKLMDDVHSLLDISVAECVLARIPLSIGDIIQLVKSRPILDTHMRYVFPLLLPGGRYAIISVLNNFIMRICGHIVGAVWRPRIVIGEYASVWEAVRVCAGYSANCVKWIDVHGAQPEEVVYSHPSFARNEQAVKVIREAEKCVVEKADIITVQSEVMMSHLLETHGKGLIAYAYQCGADTDKFKPDAWSREQVRRSLGYQSNDCVIVYAGGTASWQMVPETLRLLAALHKHDPRCKGLIVTQSDHETVIKLAKSCGLPEKAFSLRRATHEEVPAYLSASDIGVLLRVDNVVNRVACPTKLGEYLACGLPVIVGPVAKHWPWFLTDNISYTVNNLINVECDAEAVLGFIRAVCVERIATGERCRQMAVEKLSRSRDRNVLQRDVMPVLHRLQNEYRKQKN